ncbi:MAG: SUMF1/EgtB/PvdO family nonheme iron enzyme, partial [Hyphomicrobiales bacterium]
MRAARSLAVFLLISAGFVSPAVAERVALVIGNSDYVHVPYLKNPRNDAAAVATVLERLGFKVVSGIDTTRAQMEQKVRDFALVSRGAEVALFYYAGHGLQVNGHNYLAPVDAKLDDEADLDFQTVELETILKNMEREPRTNLVFLDACRDNPLAKNLTRSMGTRSTAVGRGLARVETGIGTLIAFATQPGNVALDGSGDNSPFASALLKHIESPGLDVAQLMRRVRVDVIKETANKQVPWSNSSLTGDFFFKGGTAGVPDRPAPAPAPMSEAAEAWSATKDTKSVDVLNAFIKQFPDSIYARLAEARLKDLGREKVAVGIFPEQPTVQPPTSQVPVRRLLPGESFSDCDVCPDMTVVPAGNFMMGSGNHEKGRDKNEGPQRKVTIARPFAVAKFEATVGQFRSFVQQTSYRAGHSCPTYENGTTQERTGRNWDNPGHAQSDRHPVVCVSWRDVMAYVDWLKEKTGKPYRLLTEAEWEYSARAGMSHAYHWGNDLNQMCKYANGLDTSVSAKWRGRVACNDGSGEWSMPVGSYLPNGFGLHDMAGNVREYEDDCWAPDYQGAPTDGSARKQSPFGCGNNGIR